MKLTEAQQRAYTGALIFLIASIGVFFSDPHGFGAQVAVLLFIVGFALAVLGPGYIQKELDKEKRLATVPGLKEEIQKLTRDRQEHEEKISRLVKDDFYESRYKRLKKRIYEIDLRVIELKTKLDELFHAEMAHPSPLLHHDPESLKDLKDRANLVNDLKPLPEAPQPPQPSPPTPKQQREANRKKDG